jgi:hypothetical protein
LFKLIKEDGVWQELRKKYLKDKTIGEANWKSGDSHFWPGLMKIKDHFLGFVLHNGTSTSFWEDKWLGDYTLKHNFHLCIILLGRNIQSFPKPLVAYL